MRTSIARLSRSEPFQIIIAPLRRPLTSRRLDQHSLSPIPTPSSLFSQLYPQKPSFTPLRHFSSTPTHPQNHYSHPNQPPHPNFYRTHSRAFLKSFTLAFLTYQIAYWFWLTIEAEEIRDSKNAEIRGLEGEVRLLEEGRKGHGGSTSTLISQGGRDGDGREGEGRGKRLLEESPGGKGRSHGHGHGHRGHVDMEGDVDEEEDT